MNDQIKALLSKSWKNESLELSVGRHHINEVLVIRVNGSVEKQPDQLINPTVSIPLIPTMALLIEKCGVNKETALTCLRDAIKEAMTERVKEDKHIQKKIEDVQSAISSVRQDLIEQLPKLKRSGRVHLNDLEVSLLSMSEMEELAVA